MFQPKLETLPRAQQRLWPKLSFTRTLGFTLYGGTAIAVQLGHRISVDFDFFHQANLNRAQIFEVAPFLVGATVIQDEPNALTVLAADSADAFLVVKVSFFGAINFGRYQHPKTTNDGILDVACLEDLLATKLKVILQRAEAKDYIDIAALINSGLSLATGLAIAKEMFGPNFQASESLKALSYFNDGDLSTLPTSTKSVLINAAARIRELPKVKLLKLL
jgi:Nucleotidyl transferase AbiEii toxin, Type IV TA system